MTILTNEHKGERRIKVAKESRVNAIIDPDLKKKLYIALIEDDLNFTEWLHQQIHRYLGEREKPTRKLKGKEALHGR
jgi:hypothetical protein